ncbi:MAG TPA: hypothetical protein VGB99_01055 [Acidobacteriota bacterium]
MDRFGSYTLQLGRAAIRDQDWDRAIRMLLASLDENPEYFETYEALALAYEGAEAEFGDPELLQLARRVCLGAKRQTLTGDQIRRIEELQARFESKLERLQVDFEPATRLPHDHGEGSGHGSEH